MVPPPSEATRRWLPILQPEGYPPEQQVALKRAWSLFLSSLREGDREEIQSASQRLAAVLENLKSPPVAQPLPRWRGRFKARVPTLQVAGVRRAFGEPYWSFAR
ncbi:MAG: hypothetical protein Q8R91_07985 [Candidatus Omnitrophota bacterium]|nr:hypothetical protein [Candidatus Omnitrophota bacterium]